MIWTCVYVSGYHYGTSRGDISNFFYYYNVDSILMKKGFCFVDFDSNCEAERALRNMNGQWMDGRKIKVEKARPPSNLDFSEIIKAESEPNIKLESPSFKLSNQVPSKSSLIRCEACCNRFNYTDYRPRSLPCGHTVCSHCIKIKLFRSNSACPFCRTFCGDWKAPSDYPNNYFVLKLLDYESKIILDIKKPFDFDPDLENYKQLELSQTINHIYSCNGYLIDLKSYKNEHESKLKALQEDIFSVDKKIKEGETILKKLKNIQVDIKSVEEEVDLTLVTSVAKLFYQEFMKWSKDALNKINSNDSFTSKMEDTSQSIMQSNDVAMLDFLAPTVDSDDEREIVTVGNCKKASDTILSSTTSRITTANKTSPTSFRFEKSKNSGLENLSTSRITTATTTLPAPFKLESSLLPKQTTTGTTASQALRSIDGQQVFLFGKDVQLGWIYIPNSRKCIPPKIPRKYRNEEKKSYNWSIYNKSDLKMFLSDTYSVLSWFKDFKDSCAQEIIKVMMMKKCENKSCENIDNLYDDKVVTSMTYDVSVTLLLFYDVPVPECLKSDLKVVLDSIINEEQVVFPTSISNGIRELKLYDGIKVKTSNDMVFGLKEAFKTLRDKNIYSLFSVFVSDGKIDEAINK